MTSDQQNSGVSVQCVVHTPEGLVPVNWIGPGDLIETKDAGFQPVMQVRRLGRRPGAMDLGCGMSGDQRVLVAGWPIEMYFGCDDMLACAGTLADPLDETIEVAQIVMAKPMLVRVDDVWIESHIESCQIESHEVPASLYPVLGSDDVALVRRAFGCPVVRGSANKAPVPQDVSTTFGSQVAAA